jgi:hypothetical protein
VLQIEQYPTNSLDDLGDILATHKIHITNLSDVSRRCQIYSCDIVHIFAIFKLFVAKSIEITAAKSPSVAKNT